MKDAEDGSFNYSSLAESDRRYLELAADSLRQGMGRSVHETVSLGLTLISARRRLSRKQWQPWLKHAGIARRTTYRLMTVGHSFGKVPTETLSRFTSESLYALIQPWIPAELRDFCIEQAGDGEEISTSRVETWLEAFRDPVPEEVPAKLASKDDKPKKVEAEYYYGQDNWRILLDLKGENNTLHISTVTDLETQDEHVRMIIVTEKGERFDATCASLEACILKLSGGRREKKCLKCQKTKPIDAFSKLKTSRDGRNKYCRMCESKRSWAHQKKKIQERKSDSGKA